MTHQVTRNQNILAKYIPAPAVPLISDWIYHFNFKLKIKKSRQSKYGDYRPPLPGKNHQITINHDLNPYAFLLTLVHEIAHLLCYERYKNRVKPHGEEWKACFRELMRPMMRLPVFPDDVRQSIIIYMRDPAASSCSDPQLMRLLKSYDKPSSKNLLESLPDGVHFIFGEQEFLKGPKIRTRYRCALVGTKKIYLFSGLAEVELLGQASS
jgi:SprT protein